MHIQIAESLTLRKVLASVLHLILRLLMIKSIDSVVIFHTKLSNILIYY